MLIAAHFLLLPLTVFAASQVRINEIAWMGTPTSANHEWVELYNAGNEAADLTDWTLSAADGSPQITLSGSIAGGGYFVLERTSDETLPAATADLIYVGALSNGGETLTLRDADGAVRDTAEGGTDWQNIGGDVASKQTAQRTSSGSSWVTATGTPGRSNAVSGEVAGASTDQGSAVNTPTPSETPANASSAGTASSVSVHPRSEISVLAGADTSTFTGFPVLFSGSAKGLYDESLEYATYRWNFGDGAALTGKEVTHVYPFAGEYVVVLEVVWGPHKKTDRMIVAVSQPDVTIARAKSGQDGFVEIANHTNREIDLARWSLRTHTTGKSFIFSENTILLPRKSVIFPNSMSQLFDTDVITLHSPSGGEVYRHGEIAPAPTTELVKGSTTRKPENSGSLPTAKQTLASSANTASTRSSASSTAPDSPSAAASLASTILWERGGGVHDQTRMFSENMKWFFGLAGILLVALAGFIIARSRDDEASIANEYAIIEDIIEGEIKE